jgi:hypothetical protein
MSLQNEPQMVLPSAHGEQYNAIEHHRRARIMEERDFFDEKAEQRNHTLTCPHCGKADEYQLGWLVRRKKNSLPRNADERDRARFAKAQSYMVRKDDMVACRNIRCRKRFEVAGIQSVAFLQSA